MKKESKLNNSKMNKLYNNVPLKVEKKKINAVM